jgi:esterase/lipase superfamily enzyme
MIRHSASDDHDRLQRHWNLSLPEQSDMNITTTCTAMLAIVSTLAVSGCTPGPALPVTPNLYLQAEISVLEGVPADRRTVDVDILYATDREPSESESPTKRYYDERRSDSLAVGNVSVRLGEDLSWDDLMRESLDPKGRRVPLDIIAVNELVRFPSSVSLPVWTADGELDDAPEFLAARADAEQAARDEVSRRLASADRKEVFVYIHGVGNSFSDPMYRMAELWHFLGRPGVPVVYTWPAIKGGGPLRGYTYARESSEFTVYHLRQFLQAVASCPDVERIHILAHSRGTGVTLSVLHDLRLLYMDDPDLGQRELKLGNVILAAPDIDLKVAQQRFRPDQVFRILDRMTIYVTPEDKALGIAEFLFSSLARLGATTGTDLKPEQIAALKSDRLGLDAIEVKVKQKGAHGHTYWIDNPAVLSDIILILRDDRSPGAEHGRPLIRADTGLWEIHDGYPFAGPHVEPGAP